MTGRIQFVTGEYLDDPIVDPRATAADLDAKIEEWRGRLRQWREKVEEAEATVDQLVTGLNKLKAARAKR